MQTGVCSEPWETAGGDSRKDCRRRDSEHGLQVIRRLLVETPAGSSASFEYQKVIVRVERRGQQIKDLRRGTVGADHKDRFQRTAPHAGGSCFDGLNKPGIVPARIAEVVGYQIIHKFTPFQEKHSTARGRLTIAR